MDIDFLFQLAVLFLAAKLLALVAEKLNIPQVIGEIVAGLIIGPSVLGLVQESDMLEAFAEIGVIMLMYFTGLGTDLKQLIKSGFKALVIACCGVFVPLVLGFLLYSCYYGFAVIGSDQFFTALFMGVILTATSVSITAAALQEMGKIKTETGTLIMGAAIIDDVIGMLVLTVAVGLKTPGTSIVKVGIETVLFFAFAVAAGFIVNKFFGWMEKRYPHTRRLPIFGLALCFFMAYAAEKYFGIADITGAYVAGVMLSTNKEADYMGTKIDVASYMMFSPVFFASIGIRTSISGMNASLWIYSVLFVLVALAAKIIGCGGAAKLLGCSGKESLRIGIGMMTRGEVALIISQKALNLGVLDSEYFTAVILLIIISSIVTPLALKAAYSGDDGKASAATKTAEVK